MSRRCSTLLLAVLVAVVAACGDAPPSEVGVNPYEPYPDADEEALFRHGAVVKRRGGHVVRRGGSCRDQVQFARSAWRDTTYPDRYYSGSIGFRLVSPLPKQSD